MQAGPTGIQFLIPYRNGRALTAYYLGVFSLIPLLGLVLGPMALFLGLSGRKYARSHPENGGTAHAWAGIILGGLTGFAHLAVLTFLVFALLLPKR